MVISSGNAVWGDHNERLRFMHRTMENARLALASPAPRASLQSIEMNQTPELVQPVTFLSILLARNHQHYSAFTHPLIHPTQYSRVLGAKCVMLLLQTTRKKSTEKKTVTYEDFNSN